MPAKVKRLGGDIGDVCPLTGNAQCCCAQIIKLAFNLAVKSGVVRRQVNFPAERNAPIDLVDTDLQTDRERTGLADLSDVKFKRQRNAAIKHISFAVHRAIQAIGRNTNGQPFDAFLTARCAVNDRGIFDLKPVNLNGAGEIAACTIITGCRCGRGVFCRWRCRLGRGNRPRIRAGTLCLCRIKHKVVAAIFKRFDGNHRINQADFGDLNIAGQKRHHRNGNAHF